MDNSENMIQELIGELSNRNEDVRWAAAYALVQIGEPAVGPLILALENNDSVVRLRAAWALGRIGDPLAIDSLIAVLRDGDWAVRMRAADALGRLRAASALDPLLLALPGRESRCPEACYRGAQSHRRPSFNTTGLAMHSKILTGVYGWERLSHFRQSVMRRATISCRWQPAMKMNMCKRLPGLC